MRREKLDAIDEAIKRGDVAAARAALHSSEMRSAPRGSLIRIAALSRRAGLPQLALRLLKPIVLDKQQLLSSATPAEIASHAMSLASVGAIEDARRLIDRVKTSETAEVQLFSGLIHIHHWDYEKAIPFFERYLKLADPTEYQKAVARLNYCACLSFLNRTSELLEVAEVLAEASHRNNWNLIGRDAELLLAQGFIQNLDAPATEQALARAKKIAERSALETFFVEKWSWVHVLSSRGPESFVLNEGGTLRERAIQKRLWEAVRDFDFYQAIATRDHDLIKRVYFGTPFASYRERLLRMSNAWFQPEIIYKFQSSPKAELKFELSTRGQELPVQILRALLKDFYRPLTAGGLFNSIYPHQYYDPDSSPGRLRTAVSRAREWIEKEKLPFVIISENNEYTLVCEQPIQIEVALEYGSADISKVDSVLENLRARWMHRAFTTEQAAELMNQDARKIRRTLLRAVELKKLVRTGRGRGSSFHFDER